MACSNVKLIKCKTCFSDLKMLYIAGWVYFVHQRIGQIWQAKLKLNAPPPNKLSAAIRQKC